MSFANPSDLLHGGLFVLAQWFGGSFGGAIVAASVALRVAMLPISLPATRRRLLRERRIKALDPQVAVLRRRYAKEPAMVMAETQKLYAKNGIEMFDRRSLLDMIVQLPPATALYSAIGKGISGGFLWMANLVTPDRGLATVAAAIAAAVAWASAGSGSDRQAAQWIPIAITSAVTFLILSHLSAGVAVYSITNSIVSGIEQAVVRRTLPADAE